MLHCHHCGKLLGAGKVYKIVLDNGDLYGYFHGMNPTGMIQLCVGDGIVTCCVNCHAVPGRAPATAAEAAAKKISDWPKAAPEPRTKSVARIGALMAGTDTRKGESVDDARIRCGEAVLSLLEAAQVNFREPSAADLAALVKRRLLA